MGINLSDYCCICGCKCSDSEDRHSRRRIGQRGKTGDIPAFICGKCDYINSWFQCWRVTKCLRFIVTKERRFRANLGYYIPAKPCDAIDWDYNDRLWLEVDRVYETRIDCPIKLEGVQQAA